MIILLCAHVHIAAKRHVSSAASLSPLSQKRRGKYVYYGYKGQIRGIYENMATNPHKHHCQAPLPG